MQEQEKLFAWMIQTAGMTGRRDVNALWTALRKRDSFYVFIQNGLRNADVPLPWVGLFMLGSLDFAREAKSHPGFSRGIFLNEESFAVKTWLDKLGPYMLNGDALEMTAGQLVERLPHMSDSLFIRSAVYDNKFEGAEADRGTAEAWLENCISILGPDYPLSVASPKRVGESWRLFFVGGRYVTGSQFRNRRGERFESTAVPMYVKEFAERAAAIWSPDVMFSVDVCEVDHAPKIIDFNCINTGGFYMSNMDALIQAVEEYVNTCHGTRAAVAV